MAHAITYSPRNAALVSAGRFIAQKLLHEYEVRNAHREMQRALTDAEQLSAPAPLLETLGERVRLAEGALAVACAAVDGCVLDLAESIRESLRGEAGPQAMPDDIGATILEENTERRKA